MNPVEPLTLAWAVVGSLVVCRLAGFVAASPFPGPFVSPTQRITLVVALSFLGTSIAPSQHLPATLDLRLAAMAVSELGLGLAVGVLFRIIMSAAEAFGQVAGQATGLSAPSAFNPMINEPDAPLGRVFALLALLVSLAVGAHRLALTYLFASLREVPPGTAIDLHAGAGVLLDAAEAALRVGVRLGAPMVAINLVVQVALAMVARAAPSLQILNVGLGVMLATGTLVLMSVAGDVLRGLAEQSLSLGPSLEALLGAVAGVAR